MDSRYKFVYQDGTTCADPWAQAHPSEWILGVLDGMGPVDVGGLSMAAMVFGIDHETFVDTCLWLESHGLIHVHGKDRSVVTRCQTAPEGLKN